VISIGVPDGYISVSHGKLTVSVPRNIFRGTDAAIDKTRAEPFRRMLKERYPWLTDSSLDVLMEKARREMVRTLDEETNGRSLSKELEAAGKIDKAIEHLKRHLEQNPNDADSWYALGEVLCRAGRAEEGYKAFARGRDLF
jgi:tetratricopeptide (TPR) repeat protein